MQDLNKILIYCKKYAKVKKKKFYFIIANTTKIENYDFLFEKPLKKRIKIVSSL